MSVKENVKVEEVVMDEDVILEEGEKAMKNIKRNWKTYAKYTLGTVVVLAAGYGIWKWRKSKKSTTAVVVTTPCESNDNTANEAVAPTVVEI